jgi:hypothetical protein
MLDAIIARLALAIISVDRDASYWGQLLQMMDLRFLQYASQPEQPPNQSV